MLDIKDEQIRKLDYLLEMLKVIIANYKRKGYDQLIPSLMKIYD